MIEGVNDRWVSLLETPSCQYTADRTPPRGAPIYNKGQRDRKIPILVHLDEITPQQAEEIEENRRHNRKGLIKPQLEIVDHGFAIGLRPIHLRDSPLGTLSDRLTYSELLQALIQYNLRKNNQ